MTNLKTYRLKYFLLGAIVISALGLGLLVYIRGLSHNPADSSGQPFLSKLTDMLTQPSVFPTATPMLFAEMTIPYLRQHNFTSSLGQMNKISDSSTYTSYVTSYDSEGFKINGLLTLPKGDMPEGGWPAIVFVHGYIPPQQYRTQSNYIAYVDFLARNGFVVFKIDLRGHDQSEGEPGGSYYSGDYIYDTLNARAALAGSGFVYSDKIGLWGHSMAGNVVFRSFIAAQNIPAVVIWAGAVYTYTDLSQYRISDGSYRPLPSNSERARRRKVLFDTYGQFSEESPFWKQVVPTNYLDGITGAIQIHHAQDDTVVNIEYSRNLMRILDKTQIPHELYEYKSGGHNISGGSFNQAMQKSADFFHKYLK